MIVLADLHLHEDSANTVFTEIFPHVLAEAIKQPDRSGRTIAFLGDFWHTRYLIPVKLQNEVVRFFEYCNANRVTVILLPGNHDQINPAGNHALEVFRSLVRVYSELTEDEFGLWIPYRKEFDPSWIEKPKGHTTLWLHQGIKGAIMNDHLKDQDGLSLSLFDGWRNVFAGHYHRQQQLGRVIYIGSPYQTRADEYGQEKGYGVWDVEHEVMQFRRVQWGKRYHRVTMLTDSQVRFDDFAKSDDIRIKAAADVDVEELTKDLQSRGFENVTVIPDQVVQEARLQVEAGADIHAFAQAFVEQDDTNLDKQTLLNLGRELMS